MPIMFDPDLAYANGAFIPGAEAYPPRWAAGAEAFRAERAGRARLDLPYGPSGRECLDLFLPDQIPAGLLVFVHGGYWMAFGRADWSHLAAGALARGWACALPSYTLAPDAGLPKMTEQIGAAIDFAARLVMGPIVVTGHSAGGHLAARMGNRGAPLSPATLARLARVVPISPLSDLSPLMRTGMNDTLHLTEEICAAESPARLPLRTGAHVWVGGQERPSFLWQARLLSEAWDCPWTAAPGRHHFDVIDDLTDPFSDLMAACLGGL